MLMGLDTFQQDAAFLHGKSLTELKKLSVRLHKKMRELQCLVATGVASFRRPSYSMELTIVLRRLDMANNLMDVISGYEEEDMQRYPIERFIEGQEENYADAIEELRNGKKISHWMWYVFPQLRFLGHSDKAYFYGIVDEEEAKEYCANPLLYDRYIECCKALENIKCKNPVRVMGDVDALKLHSSLTLFYMVDEKNQALYQRLIDKFYHGKWDYSTMDYLNRRRTVEMRLNDVPYQQIMQEEKRIEVRLYDEKRRKLQEGNLICFTHSEKAEMQMRVRVRALHCYNTFRELFESVGLETCGFQGYTIDEAVEEMRKYYPSQEEEKYGAVGIEITLEDNF